MAVTLRAFHAEYDLLRFDWLKVLGRLAARNRLHSSYILRIRNIQNVQEKIK